MSIATERAISAARDIPEGIATISQVNWQQFLMFDAIFTERNGVKLSYLNGILEIMSPIGKPHEKIKSNLSVLLETYCRHIGIRHYRVGGPTLQKSGYSSIEPDESYCIDSDKEIPDVVIEVIITSGSIDKLAIYRSIGVPEAWFWKQGKLAVYCLQNGEYQQSEKSALLPALDLVLLEKCANQPDQYDAVEYFRQSLK